MGLWITAAVFAFFIKGLCGFANTLTFTTILSFGAANINISPVELVLGYPANLIIAWSERKSIRWSICAPLSVLVIAGSIPGILFLKNADAQIVKIIFGFTVIFIGIEMLLKESSQKRRKKSKLLLGFIGVLSGILCGLYGVGALLGAYISSVAEDSRALKANICVVFLVENTLRMALYSAWGIITPQVLRSAVMLSPFMIAGLLAGVTSCKFLDERLVRKIVIIMLIISGAALLVNNL